MTPEQEQQLFRTLGSIEAKLESVTDVKKDVIVLKKDIGDIKIEFSGLKGKLLVIAGIVTFVLNAALVFIKKIF